MYIIKNAYLNITRSKGRNILIGILITAITACACIALSINKSGKQLIEVYQNTNPLEVSFQLDPMSFRNTSGDSGESFTSLTQTDILLYGTSDYVKDYYYTAEISMSSATITPISYTDLFTPKEEGGEMPESGNQQWGKDRGSSGDYRITGYSDASYIDSFIDGTKKIIEGTMFTKETDGRVIVISEELATANNLKVGDTITLYMSNQTDVTYDFELIGIYQDNSAVTDNFMGMNAMNSANQMYTNIGSVNDIAEATSNQSMRNQSLSVHFYLTDNQQLEAFEQEVREKGLSSYYTVITNQSSIDEALKPISNISSFSVTFLIVILVLGGTVLAVINMINIRERKYEIGVLRAIGMSKKKVSIQIITELFIVALIGLMLGTGLGIALSQPVTNQMLKGEIQSYEEQETNRNENFGGGNFERPAFNKNRGENINYIEELTVTVDGITILQLFFVSLFLTISSGLTCVMIINQYEPNKILQNRA